MLKAKGERDTGWAKIAHVLLPDDILFSLVNKETSLRKVKLLV